MRHINLKSVQKIQREYMPTSGGEGAGQSIPYVGTPVQRPLLNIPVPCLRHAGTHDRSRGQACREYCLGSCLRRAGIQDGQKKCFFLSFFCWHRLIIY